MLYSIVGILVILIDQLLKFWVEDTLFGTDIVRFIPGVISLVHVRNKGAAFSFLAVDGARIWFIAAAGVFALLVVLALATNFISGRLSRWSLVLVAAGGLGNMIDRLIYGYVVDMFKVELFNFPVFNIADIFITVFGILFVLAMFLEKPEKDVEQMLEDLEEEEAPKPRREKAPKPKPARREKDAPAAGKDNVRAARKSRQDKYEQEYAEYKAQRLAEMRKATPQSARKAGDAPAVPEAVDTPAGDNPFAAWEQANARAANDPGLAGPIMEPAPKAEPRPAPQPAPKPAPKPAPEEEFSLDDILAEFK